MPDGAKATAFASDAGCLPALEDWERFVQAPPSLLLFAAAGSPSERNKLDEWLRRVDGVLPESPKVGGVVNDDGPVCRLCENQIWDAPRDVVSVAASARRRGVFRPSMRRCRRDRVGSMARRFTKVHAIFLRIT